MSLFTRERQAGRSSGHTGTETDAERTVRIARKRFTRRQWARRWLAWRRVLVGLVLLGVVAGGLWLVFFSSVLAVHGVVVAGTQTLDPRVVRRAAAVPVGTPLASVDLDRIGARIQRLPAVRSVDVSRSWPDRVRIAVVEREPVAVVEQGGRLRGLDAQGVMFRDYPSRPRSLPLIRTRARTSADALAEAARVAGSLPADVLGRVDFVQVRTVDTISLQLRSGPVVQWGSADLSADKAKVLEVLLRQKASHYDVSAPGQPTIRP